MATIMCAFRDLPQYAALQFVCGVLVEREFQAGEALNPKP